MIACAAVAVVWVNTAADTYGAVWQRVVTIGGAAPLMLAKLLLLWINEDLMAVFFLLVGLEIKRAMLARTLGPLCAGISRRVRSPEDPLITTTALRSSDGIAPRQLFAGRQWGYR